MSLVFLIMIDIFNAALEKQSYIDIIHIKFLSRISSVHVLQKVHVYPFALPYHKNTFKITRHAQDMQHHFLIHISARIFRGR